MVVNLTYLESVIIYFKNHPLKTKKRISLARWSKIYQLVINQKHINNFDMINKIKNLAKLINIK
jgi:hypothetical protein